MQMQATEIEQEIRSFLTEKFLFGRTEALNGLRLGQFGRCDEWHLAQALFLILGKMGGYSSTSI